MTRPLLDLLAFLLLAGAGIGAFLTRRARVRLLPLLVATVVSGVAAALVLVGEAFRLTLLAGPTPARGWLLAAAAGVAMLPTLFALGRLGLHAARAPRR